MLVIPRRPLTRVLIRVQIRQQLVQRQLDRGARHAHVPASASLPAVPTGVTALSVIAPGSVGVRTTGTGVGTRVRAGVRLAVVHARRETGRGVQEGGGPEGGAEEGGEAQGLAFALGGAFALSVGGGRVASGGGGGRGVGSVGSVGVGRERGRGRRASRTIRVPIGRGRGIARVVVVAIGRRRSSGVRLRRLHAKHELHPLNDMLGPLATGLARALLLRRALAQQVGGGRAGELGCGEGFDGPPLLLVELVAHALAQLFELALRLCVVRVDHQVLEMP
ncbi:hypothetical protein B0H16DRAFT_1605757 [Mycena metata]|uniref:Uncharacterized protein n=1 Tax=Mycena metata TaxID=1033252 RepID=A0AAD7MJN3_9AGAR|nr:hypothetical protein B0H16DRAFT_1605757 [Mycena metata]